jgi:hypothetical protein
MLNAYTATAWLLRKRKTGTQNIVLLGVAVLFVASLLTLTPFSDAIVFGGDEGTEFCKAWRYAAKPEQLTLMWNDQPWLFTVIIGLLFRHLRAEAWVARIAAALFFALLIFAIGKFVQRERGFLGATIGMISFLAWPQVITLGLSAMSEIPAMALALTSAWIIPAAQSSNKKHLVGLSGILFALALHMKFTALIALPAALSLFFIRSGDAPSARVQQLKECIVFVIFATATFFVGIWISPVWSWSQIVGTHLAIIKARVWEPQYCLSPMLFLQNPGILLPAAWLLWHEARCRNLKSVSFALTWLITAVCVHAVYRPWWDIYSVHFAVPLAILSGAGITLAFKKLRPWISRRYENDLRCELACPLALLSLWFVWQLPVIKSEIKSLSSSTLASKEPIIEKMRQDSTQSQLAFVEKPAYAFHAKVWTPPEFVNFSKKRFWSGNLDSQIELDYLTNHNPDELLLLKKANREPREAWDQYLNNNYTLVCEDFGLELLIANRLGPEAIPSEASYLQLINRRKP